MFSLFDKSTGLLLILLLSTGMTTSNSVAIPAITGSPTITFTPRVQNTATPTPTFILQSRTPTPAMSVSTPTPSATLRPNILNLPTVTPESQDQEFQDPNAIQLAETCLTDTKQFLLDGGLISDLGAVWPNPTRKELLANFVCWFNAGGTVTDLETIVNKFAQPTEYKLLIKITEIEIIPNDTPELMIRFAGSHLPVFILTNTNKQVPNFVGYILPDQQWGDTAGLGNYGSQPPVQFVDLTGDDQVEIILQYVDSAPATWVFITAYKWHNEKFRLIFKANLVTWASPTTMRLIPDPTHPRRQQIVLAFAHFYNDAYDHKLYQHPLAQQLWRWSPDQGLFRLVEENIYLDKSSAHTYSGPPAYVEPSVTDQLNWLINEGEESFRLGEYDKALIWFNKVLHLTTTENWKPDRTPYGNPPDWRVYAAWRRAQALILQDTIDPDPPMRYQADGLEAMQKIALGWTDDLPGQLAAAFLQGYGSGEAHAASVQALLQMQSVEIKHPLYENSETFFGPITVWGLFHQPTLYLAYLNGLETIESPVILTKELQQLGLPILGIRILDTNYICVILTEKYIDYRHKFLLFRKSEQGWRQIIPTQTMEWPTVGVFQRYYRGPLCADQN